MAVTLAWQYLDGQVRATDSRDERRVEWPPHPGRVWLALASQWFQGGQSPDERSVLEALREAPEPQLWIPAAAGQPRTPVGVYVPVNDTAEGNSHFGDLTLGRVRQERFFPTLYVGEQTVCALHWDELVLPEALVTALRGLASRLCYLGQAASMVRAWVSCEAMPPPGTMVLQTMPGIDDPVWHLRGFGCGFSLAELSRWYDAGRTPISRGWIPYGLCRQTPGGPVPRPLSGVVPPETKEPADVFSLSRGKEIVAVRNEDKPKIPAVTTETNAAPRLETGRSCPFQTPWEPDLTFFLQISGLVAPTTDILAVVYALRQEMGRRCRLPLPSWLTGHQADGQPLRQNTWYMGSFPVAHLGVEGGNGRLVGLALARPRTISTDQWKATLSPLLAAGQFPVTLPDGGRMVWQLPSRPISGVFHPSLWTGGENGSYVWATTTPMVLDQVLSTSPKPEFREKLSASIKYSCQLAGLPDPVEVIARRDPWWAGSFPAWGKTHDEQCFPPDWRFQRRRVPRFHVWLRFPSPVQGPLALGRLRFQGYGVFWAIPDLPPPSPDRRLALKFPRDMSSPQVYLFPRRT